MIVTVGCTYDSDFALQGEDAGEVLELDIVFGHVRSFEGTVSLRFIEECFYCEHKEVRDRTS